MEEGSNGSKDDFYDNYDSERGNHGDFFRFILFVAFLILIIYVGGFVYNKFNKTDNRTGLERAVAIDDTEISIRQLFEAAYEDIAYAGHASGQATYAYSCDSYVGSIKYSTEIQKADISFDRYYTDKDNYVVVQNGQASFKYEPYQLYCFVDVKKINNRAKFTIYDGMENGENKTALSYTGDKNIVEKIDIDSVIMPDLSSIENLNMEITYHDYSKIFKVTITGDNLDYYKSVLSGMNGAGNIKSVEYVFDSGSKRLKNVYVKGPGIESSSTTSEETPVFNLTIQIKSVEYGDAETVAIPEQVSENADINDFFRGEKNFAASSKIEAPLIKESSWAEDAGSITKKLSDSSDAYGYNLQDYTNALLEASSEKGYDVDSYYYTLADDKTVMMRFVFSQEGQEKGTIYIPIVMGEKGLVYNVNMVVSADDLVTFYTDGSIKILHEISDSLSCEARYALGEEGTYDLVYEITKESKASNLSDDDERKAFAGDDESKILPLIEEYGGTKYASIVKLVIWEDDACNTYYSIDMDADIDSLEDLTGLEFITQQQYLGKVEDEKADTEIEWVEY